MDTTQLDRWARTIAMARSRRGAMGLLIAGALAGMVESEGIAKNKGKGKGQKRGCKKSEKKCGKKCIRKGDCCSSDDCVYCRGEVCQPDGTCRCNPGTSVYNGVCGHKPDCLPVPYVGGPGPSACCSGNAIQGDQGYWACMPGTTKCLSDYDCATGSIGRCRGFLCPELYHQAQPDCPQ